MNAICTYAGSALCSSQPFTGAALDESYVKAQAVTARDLNGVKEWIVLLRTATGASPASLRDAVVAGMPVRAAHMDDLRAGAR